MIVSNKERITKEEYQLQEKLIGDDVIASHESDVIHSLGTLNWKIYNCITNRHIADEVIITEEQIRHMKERHPEAYQDTVYYLRKVLDHPDYIFRDKHPDTGLVVKEMRNEKKESFLLVLKIAVSDERKGYKNSVITSWKITEKRLNNYLRNKDIIYKRE